MLTEEHVLDLIDKTGASSDFAKMGNGKHLSRAAFLMESILGTTSRTKRANKPGKVEFTGPLHYHNSYPAGTNDEGRLMSTMHSFAEEYGIPVQLRDSDKPPSREPCSRPGAPNSSGHWSRSGPRAPAPAPPTAASDRD